MKFRTNNYKLENPKIIEPATIVAISDIHGNLKVLKKLLELVEIIKPNYICIPGDTLDMTNCDISNIIEWFTNISSIAKTVISLGNHDLLEYNHNNKKERWSCSENIHFYENIDKISNCILLNDSFSTYSGNEFLSFSGLNMPASWYEHHHEDKAIFETFIKSVDENKLDIEKFNILLSHSPNRWLINNRLISSEEFKILNKISLILSGHNHGGLVPIFLQPIFKNNHGFVGPGSKINQENAFGTWSNENTSLILSNGVTKIANSSELSFISDFLNSFYIPDIESISLVPGKQHKLTKYENKIY